MFSHLTQIDFIGLRFSSCDGIRHPDKKELQAQTIDDFQLNIEGIIPILLMQKRSWPLLNKNKNIDLTGQGDTANLQLSIVNFQFGYT